MTTTERRQHERVAVSHPATVDRIGVRPASVRGATLDLSEGGAKVHIGTGTFRVGDVVVVTIEADGALSLRHQGLVVGATPEGVLNVAFKTLDDEAVVDLRRVLALA